ncbi:uncharacterized protein LOC34620445 [Cyclospora cayetanensis]|uniref:Uncharacterized protein LOC34620445 n=2 Tax=Cyclospora cayetanensis TaxID=88456 RepID=A0A6P5WCY7_9EIME|nr:uncharacterized protein LOC34620445 [Cyclospora cayetanensis]OEH75454.1 hypothetical protein cyc_03814 [Cyclospora cayetanensis]
MSSSFSIEISDDAVPRSGDLTSDSSSTSQEFDLTPSEPSALVPSQASQPPEWQAVTDRGEEAGTPPGLTPRTANSASVGHSAELTVFPVNPATSSLQRDPQPQLEWAPDASSSQLDAEYAPSSKASHYGREAFEPRNSVCSVKQQEQRQEKKLWNPSSSSLSAPEGNPVSGQSPVPAAKGSFRVSVSTVPPGRQSTGGQPCEGILKRRTEKWTEQSIMGEDVIGSRGRLWLAPGSVLWRFFLCVLALRIGSSLALLVVVLTTLGQMGRAVSCVDMSNCVGGGGIMAFPILLRALPSFGAGIVAYEAITGSLVAGLVLVLVPMAGNCYYTCQALLKGTRKAYLEEVRVTTCCAVWVSACVGVFIPPAFFTQQFCNTSSFDVNAALRSDSFTVEAVSSNMCRQTGMSQACIAVALLCACSTALLQFQRYSRLWATLLALGSIKFMFGGFLLCFTVMFGGQSNQMMLEVMDDTGDDEGLQAPMIIQQGLFFASLKWGGFILAFGNMACGAFTVWMAYLRSNLLSCTNMVLNFVFFFVNAVSFFAMMFQFTTLQVVCNYSLYPMTQTSRALAEAAFFCTFKPQFMFVWLFVALLAFLHLFILLVSAILFHKEYCRPMLRTGVLVAAPSVDSLPPKWGAIKR